MARPPQPLVAGNWKMHGLRAQLGEIEAIRDAVRAGAAGEAEVLICPPSTLIRAAAEIAAGSSLKIGGQNCHSETHGAHTGDVSAAMLKDAGASYVIVGHSERRADHQETNVIVRSKAAAAIRAGLQPIVCVGETKADRDAGRAQNVVHRQLAGSLPTAEEAVLAVAYEPIWAIGTGVTPTADDIADMHAFLRREIERLLPQMSAQVRLLYGGSVKASNARELLAVADVDGALIGGASLTAQDFLGVAACYRDSAAVAV